MTETRRDFIKKSGSAVLATTVTAGCLVSARQTEAQQQRTQRQLPEGIGRTTTAYNWKPEAVNQPVGTARGIFPGRVAWAHAPGAAHWNGNRQERNLNRNAWWLDTSTDQKRVAAMVADTIAKVTGQNNLVEAWKSIFRYYNAESSLGTPEYRKDQIVAIKINMNATGRPDRNNCFSDVAPQTVHAVVEQLVKYAGVPSDKIIVYDAMRPVYSALVQKIWADFRDVRFMQRGDFADSQRHPVYGDHRLMENPEWIAGTMEYSNGLRGKNANNLPKQIVDATYLINLAMLKGHSYAYGKGRSYGVDGGPNIPEVEGGDEGQTAVTLLGKNHFGSIQGPSDLHAAVNTLRDGRSRVYSPIVDLMAAPKLGGKTILHMLDGLYVARKHSSFPVHFPHAPFNNTKKPYANPEWPSCILASLDPVALDSVGVDILYSQTEEEKDIYADFDDLPNLLIREYADDYLHEMAMPDSSPSGTKYMQGGKPVKSQGVHEHWDGNETRRYSRNIDPANGKGIELVYTRLE